MPENTTRWNLTDLLDIAPTIVLLLDLQGHIQHANRQFEELTGYSLDEFQGREWFTTFLPERDQHRIRTVFQTAVEGTPVRGYVNPILTRDGREREIEWHARAVEGEEGGIISLLSVGIDVTDRVHAEEALHIRETAIASAINGIAIADASGALTYVNRSLVRLWGYDHEDELLGRSMLSFWENLEEAEQVLAKLHETGAWTGELVARRENDSTPTFEVSANSVRDSSGAVTALMASFVDVTERKVTEAREASRSLRLSHLSELSLMLSGEPGTVFERVVRLVGELFQVPVVCLSEIAGENLVFRAVFLNGQVLADAGACPLRVTPCSTVEQSRDIRVFDRVSERFPEASFLRDHQAYSYCGFPSLDGAGRVVAVTCLLDDKPHDFTEEDSHLLRIIGQRVAAEMERARNAAERAATELSMRESLREKEMLLREIHHRVKNNLQVIMSFLYFQSKKVTDAPTLSTLEELKRRLMAMVLVHEKLYQSDDLARIEFGDYLCSLVNHLAQSAQLAERGISVEVRSDTCQVPMETALPAGMIITELLTNSGKYAFPADHPGRIEVNLTRTSDGLELAVSDNGVGLPNGFDPENATTFGWRLIRNLTDQIEGTLTLAPGPGTRVRISIPL
jgi:PAS domain S-box-containing protein